MGTHAVERRALQFLSHVSQVTCRRNYLNTFPLGHDGSKYCKVDEIFTPDFRDSSHEAPIADQPKL